MILGRTLLIGFLVLGASGASAAAPVAERCFTRAEQRAKTAAHAVVPLSRAMRAVKKHGEVIHARLCERAGHLVYLLTVLAHDGKVGVASVDAANGAVVAARPQQAAHPQEKVGKDLKKAK